MQEKFINQFGSSQINMIFQLKAVVNETRNANSKAIIYGNFLYLDGHHLSCFSSWSWIMVSNNVATWDFCDDDHHYKLKTQMRPHNHNILNGQYH